MLQPCDLSLSYAASDGESAVTMVLSASEVTVHLVEAVVRTLAQVGAAGEGGTAKLHRYNMCLEVNSFMLSDVGSFTLRL